MVFNEVVELAFVRKTTDELIGFPAHLHHICLAEYHSHFSMTVEVVNLRGNHIGHEDIVGVEYHDEFTCGLAQTAVHSGTLAGIALESYQKEIELSVQPSPFFHNGNCRIRRAIIYNNALDLPVCLPGNALKRLCNNARSVECRYDYGDKRVHSRQAHLPKKGLEPPL